MLPSGNNRLKTGLIGSNVTGREYKQPQPLISEAVIIGLKSCAKGKDKHAV